MMNEITFRDKKLVPLWDRIRQGKRLSLADGLVLFRSNDLISLGKMAGFVQDGLNGDAVYFTLNQKMDVNAFTAVEIDIFHKQFKLPVKEILKQLKETGLKTLGGDGAEVFSERIRKKLFPKKIGAHAWLQIHATAHRLGISTNAAMLYGHIETYEERLRHMIMLREAQDETGGFLAFIPLLFQPMAEIKPNIGSTSAIDDLKMIAVSRLMLDNFPHIKAPWTMQTEDVAAVALNFGADDLEGTVGKENIAHDAGTSNPPALAKDRLIKIIRDAGKIPVERDACYHPLDIYADKVIGKIPYLNSARFYRYFEKEGFKLLPVMPRRLGMLSLKGKIAAGPFSLTDYLAQEDSLELMGPCIAARNQAKTALLFSRKKWPDLAGRNIGVTDDAAASALLLRVLAEKKYGIEAHLVRMEGATCSDGDFAAVLLIGDEALRFNKCGLPGFEYVFDLAAEWYNWQRLPFVFAVWAERKSLPPDEKRDLREKLRKALAREKREPSFLITLHGRHTGMAPKETRDFLDEFTFILGKQEKKAIGIFRDMVASL